jgi:hypothetical protein
MCWLASFHFQLELNTLRLLSVSTDKIYKAEISIGSIYFHTNLCTKSYIIIISFTPIRISAFKSPSSGGHSVRSIDYTSIVYVITSK